MLMLRVFVHNITSKLCIVLMSYFILSDWVEYFLLKFKHWKTLGFQSQIFLRTENI
jgi:hypothetical protein